MKTNSIFLLPAQSEGEPQELMAKIIRWLMANLMIRSISVNEAAPDQSVVEFITKSRKQGFSIFTDLNDNQLLELQNSAVGEMNAHVVDLEYDDGRSSLDISLNRFFIPLNANEYQLFTMLSGVRSVVTGKERVSDDERPKLPWE